MSASREKRVRQERGTDYVSPKEEKARKESADIRRTTVIFTVCAILFIVGVAAMLVWNSGVIQRSAAAATVNGESFTAGDVSFFYQNARVNLLNSNAGSGVDSSVSLRKQEHTAAAGTWYDYVIEQAMNALSNAASLAQAAKSEGFDGTETVEKNVSDALENLGEAAATYGYSVPQYIKAVYGPLMTQKTLERNLRMTALADAYSDHIQSIDQYSDADLTAAYEENHDLYSTVRYECIAVLSSSYMSDEESGSESTTTDSASGSENSDADVKAAAALAAAQEAAAEASSRVKNGESAEAVADEIGATYSDSSTYYSSTGELSVWLFDDARREGDVTVLDYYGVGAQVVVFHGKQRADFFPVNVRHILVEDEDKANELLAQFNAGDKTEASFAALATENTTDTGSASNGGLYEDIYIGQMVKPFEDWCFDSSRKAGDVGIVKTDYGYHVMYFCSTGTTPYWKTLAAVKLANDKLSSITGAAETETLNGVKYVDQ